MTVENVGVVGLDALGLLVVARLVAAGRTVAVYDERPERRAAAVSLGADAVALPADAAQSAGVIVLAAPDERTAEEWLFDLGGVGETLRTGGLVVDASSSGPRFRRDAEQRLSRFGIRYLDIAAWADLTALGLAA